MNWSDTHVISTLLFHFEVFVQEGLDQLLAIVGLGNSTPFIPLRILHQKLRPNFAKVLPALQSLTGSDNTCKVGKIQHCPYLQSTCKPLVLLRCCMILLSEAEQSLVKMFDSGCIGKDFTELNIYLFHHSKSSSSLQSLSPTSQGLKPYIQCSHSQHLHSHAHSLQTA